MTIIRIGLDTSKRVFQVHGVDEHERPVLRRQLGRAHYNFNSRNCFTSARPALRI